MTRHCVLTIGCSIKYIVIDRNRSKKAHASTMLQLMFIRAATLRLDESFTALSLLPPDNDLLQSLERSAVPRNISRSNAV
jgi:hypothetical protein